MGHSWCANQSYSQCANGSLTVCATGSLITHSVYKWITHSVCKLDVSCFVSVADVETSRLEVGAVGGTGDLKPTTQVKNNP